MKSDKVDAVVGVLLSGGRDSATVLWHLLHGNFLTRDLVRDGIVVAPIFVDYGQIMLEKEREAAGDVVDYCRAHSAAAKYNLLPLSHMMATVGDCTLAPENGEYAQEYANRPKAYVPNRNNVLVMTALSKVEEIAAYYEVDSFSLCIGVVDADDPFGDVTLGWVEDVNRLVGGRLYAPLLTQDSGKIWDSRLVKTFTDNDWERLRQKGTVVWVSGEHSNTMQYFVEQELLDLCFSGYGNKELDDDKLTFRRREGAAADVTTTKTETEKMGTEVQEHDEHTAHTSLMDKEHQPMVIRKFTQYGFPLYVALICGANLDNLDALVHRFCGANMEAILSNSIQDKRNVCGAMTDMLVREYNRGDLKKTEGVAVVWYVDKMLVSSLFGDFMTHGACKAELYAALNMMCHI